MVTTRCTVELASDPLSVILPTYYDVSPHLASVEWWRGKQKELDGVEAGGMTVTLDNDQRRFELGRFGDPTTATLSGNEVTDVTRLANVAGDGRPFQDQERWGDFEAASAGSATGWDSLEAASAANQFTTVTTAGIVTKGTKAGKFTVRPGDVVSSGERSEVVWTAAAGGWGTGLVDGQTHFWEGSVRCEGPWQHTTAWEIFHQVHADSRFGQAPVRLQINDAKTHWEWRLVTGDFADSTAALAGTNPSVDLRWEMLPFEDDVNFYYRYAIRWASDDNGWVIVDMKREGDAGWTRYVQQFGIQTLPTYPAQGAGTSVFLKWGLYRHPTVVGVDNYTNVVYHDAITGGHRWSDVELAPTFDAESSVGIYEDATNLATNGSFETNASGGWGTNGAGASILRVTSEQYFGDASLQLTMTGASSSEAAQLTPTLSNGTVYGVLVRVKTAAAGQRYRVWVVDNASTTLVTQTFVGDGEWHWHWVRFTATANNTHKLRVGRTATGSTQVLYIDGFMYSTSIVAQPYIHTDGATAARGTPRVQLPAAGLSETEGWFMALVRMGYHATDAPSSVPYLFRWRDDDNNEIRIRYETSSDQWVVYRAAGGSSNQKSSATQNWRRGEYLLVVGKWNATDVAIRVNMEPFLSNGSLNIPTLAATTFDVGSSGTDVNFLNGDVLWAAWGTDADALDDDAVDAIWLRSLDERDPWQADLADYGVLHVWTAAADTVGGDPLDLWRRARVTLEDGTTGMVRQGVYYLHEPKLNYYGKSNHNAVTFGYVDGTGLQANQNLPRMNPPDASSLEDVITFRRPTLYLPLTDPEGNKAMHHVRAKRKRRKHESRRHYRRHGFRHWTTKTTRSDAEGVIGNAGTYKNTPALGEPGFVVGDDGTSVRFRASQSEHVRVPVDEGDTLDGSRLSVLFLGKLASSPAAVNTAVAGPKNGGSGDSLWQFGTDGSGHLQAFIGAAGSVGDITGATVLTTNQTYMAAVTWDGDRAKIYWGRPQDDALTLDASESFSGDMGSAAASPVVLIGGLWFLGSVDFFWNGWLQHVQVYERGLELATLQDIFDASFHRGYDQQSAGARIAALADEGLFWDSSRVQTGGPQVQPIFHFGQSPLDEVDAAVEAEMPDSHYYHDGDGYPVYLSSTYRSAAPYDSVSCFLSDDPADAAAGAVQYDDSQVDWDSELYNVVPASKDGGEEQLATDQASIDLRLEHVFTGGTGLSLVEDSDVQALADRIAQRYAGPPIVRPFSVTLHGADDAQRPHIFLRDIGELVRFKRRGETGDAIDVLCVILGWKKRYERGQVTCTWNLSRPVADLSDGAWHIGVEGFSEIGQTTILG